jgi:hypothetical protein
MSAEKEGEGRPDDVYPGRSGKLAELPLGLEDAVDVQGKEGNKRNSVPYSLMTAGAIKG